MFFKCVFEESDENLKYIECVNNKRSISVNKNVSQKVQKKNILETK